VIKHTKIFGLAFGVLLLQEKYSWVMAQQSQAGMATNSLGITSVSVAGRPVPLQGYDEVNLGAYPENIIFSFKLNAYPEPAHVRLRFQLQGFENDWHEGGPQMFLAVRFYNDSGDQVDQDSFTVQHESAGWNGSLSNSSLTHRRETLTVPPLATRMMIVISSAGPPATEGVYVVANLMVSKSTGKSSAVELLRSPFNEQPDESGMNQAPNGWMRDGNHASMAKIVSVGHDSATKAFAILDDDVASHAEWRNTWAFAPKVTPGDNLVIEWNEMYSMGVGDLRIAAYSQLMPGTYKLDVQAVNIFGTPTGTDAFLKIIVPQPFWKMPWFWGIIAFGFTLMMLGVGRYMVWHKMRREMLGLKHQQELERERLRIAHDIHDDLGARVTKISLLSAMSQKNPALPESARDDFIQISKMSRELVSALYETVWTVNPANDNLEALGNYLCQMVNQLCGGMQLRCRFHMQDLPREIEVSSQTRHNISLAVKEAVHNVIKHADASEVSVYMTLIENVLTVSVQDNGRGFRPSDKLAGNGLTNMKQRLEDIGGSYLIESELGKGTSVYMRWPVKSIYDTY